MTLERYGKGFEKAPALAGDFRAVRGELHTIADRNDLLKDAGYDIQQAGITTLIPNGYAQMSKVAFSAQFAAIQDIEDSRKRLAEKERKEKSEHDMRLAYQAAWDAKKVIIGGVEMTNAEAQEARRHILERREEYVRRAVRNGEMSEERAERVIRGIRREHDWAEKERNGTLTDEERAQRREWRKTKDCAEAEKWTGERVRERRAERNAEIGGAKASEENKVDVDSSFAKAPDVGESFAQATAGTTPAPEPEEPIPAAPATKLQQIGLGL